MITVCSKWGYFTVGNEEGFSVYPVVRGFLVLFIIEGGPSGVVNVFDKVSTCF